MQCENNIKQYLLLFTHKNGNGYAVVNATDPKVAENVFKAQTKYEDAGIVSIKELRWFGQEMQLVEEGSVVTYGLSLYDLAVYNGYKGTLLEFMESMRGPEGPLGPSGLIEEEDPTVPPHVKAITSRDITNWNSKTDNIGTITGITMNGVSKGTRGVVNLGTVVTSESDPTVPSHVKSITQLDIDKWNLPGCFVVNITESSNNFTADATFDDIFEAKLNNETILALYSDYIYQLAAIILDIKTTDITSKSCQDNIKELWFFRISNGPTLECFRLYTNWVEKIDTNSNKTYEPEETWLNNTIYLQLALISGTSIKTINNETLLGPGNIEISTSGDFSTLCPIIEDTRSSAVAAITGVAPFASLVDGQRIFLHLNQRPANNSTLRLTLSDGSISADIPIYFYSLQAYTNISRFGALNGALGMYLHLIFEGSQWVALGFGDGNTQYAVITQSDLNTGTATTSKTITAKILHDNAYIVEETYSSGSLKANKFYDFGTVSTALTIPSLDATNDLVSNALNFYALRFVAGADDLNITFPTGVIVDDEPTINTGDYVEIMINLYVENNTNHFYASIKVWQAQ